MASRNLIRPSILALQRFQRVDSSIKTLRNACRFTDTCSKIQSEMSSNMPNHIRSYHKALITQEPQVVKVPTMGDSITEGTIVEWEKKVGDAVSEGDVVALIETDKVTVDIKAEMDGVITALYGGVDDTVEVGAKLYQIDAEAAPAEKSSTESSDAKASTPDVKDTVATEAASTSAPPLPSLSTNGHRTPSIHFLGKSGWAALKRGETSHDEHPAPPRFELGEHFDIVESLVPDDPSWDPMYGRPPIIEDEMDALILGGAEGANVPQLVTPSRGAVFA